MPPISKTLEAVAALLMVVLLSLSKNSIEIFSLLNSFTSQQRWAVQSQFQQNLPPFVTLEDVFPQSRNFTLHNNFDERLPVAAFYRQLEREVVEKQGDLSELTIDFHWGDWMNLHHSRVLFDAYNARSGNNITTYGKLWDAFKSRDFIRDRNTPVLTELMKSDAWLWEFMDAPERVIAITENGYYQVPVANKRLIGEQGLWDEFYGVHNANYDAHSLATINLVAEAHQLDESNLKFHKAVDWKQPIPKTIHYTKADFEWNLEEEIARLEATPDKTPAQIKHTKMLRTCRDVAPNDAFFMYPINYLETDPRAHGDHTNLPFFGSIVRQELRRSPIHHMMRNYAKFMRQAGYNYWVFSGNAISWYFNGNNMPWDEDIDVRMTVREMDKMAQTHNGTLVIEDPREGEGLYYFQISPWYARHTRLGNHIDSRFIDIRTGLYIDITCLNTPSESKEETLERDELFDYTHVADDQRSQYYDDHTALTDKNGNWFWLDDFADQFRTLFEGTMIHMPVNFERTLKHSYGDGVLTTTEFDNFHFVTEIGMWVNTQKCDVSKYEKEVLDQKKAFDDKGQLTLAGACGDPQLLEEWGRAHTSFQMHMKEKKLLKEGSDERFQYSSKDLPIYWHDDFVDFFDYYETEGSGTD